MDINNFYKQCVAGLNATCCNGDDVKDDADIRNRVKKHYSIRPFQMFKILNICKSRVKIFLNEPNKSQF